MGAAVVKIAAITSGRNVPSARFRVRQYIDLFNRRGHHLVEYCPIISKYAGPTTVRSAPPVAERIMFAAINAAKMVSRLPAVFGSRRYDAIWLEREMLSQRFTLERFLKRPIVFDVDDAIWSGGEHAANAAAAIARRADVILAGNSYIGEWFSRHSRDVRIVPTAVDTDRFNPRSGDTGRRFRLVWTGSASTLRYLSAIEPPVHDFLTRTDSELLVVADVPPQFTLIPAAKVVFVRWSPDSEAEALRSADVGLMPLPDDEWARGKCSLKMIQYMATGLPSIVSPVGMNRDILSMAEVGFGATGPEEWRGALDTLWGDASLRRRLGSAGRELAVNRFSRDVVFRTLANVFESFS